VTDDRIAAVFSALSDPTRREVMRLISSEGEATATELAERVPVSRQAIVKHLAMLSEAGLVVGDRHGRQMRYRLTPQPFGDAMSWMADVGAEWDDRLDALQRLLRKRRSTD
jgi:DNA-binding transcriptional ArsR family regulator